MFLKSRKKIYTSLLNAEVDARQIRSFKNGVIASNKAGKDLFGDKENPFAFLKNVKNTASVQKLIDSYCLQKPFETQIKTDEFIWLIRIQKMDVGLLITAIDKSADFAVHFSMQKQLDFVSEALSTFIYPVYFTDNTGVIVYANKKMCDLFDLSFNELLGTNLTQFMTDAHPDFLGFWQGNTFLNTKNGIISAEIHQHSFEIDENIYFCGTILDKTNLTAIDDQFLMQHAPLPLATIHALDYHILSTNKAFDTLFCENNSNYQNSIFDLLTNTSKEALKTKIDKFLENTNKNTHIDIVSTPLYGSKTFTVFMGYANATQDNLILYLIDASERQNLELQFAHAQKMQAMGQLAGGVAHDFNNLLTAIIGFCDLLLQKHHVNDDSFLDIMQIKGSANKASGLVGQLLTFSRKQPSKIQTINFHDSFVDLSALLQRSISPFVKLKMDLKRNLGYIKIDPNHLTQIFLNLAVNAKDAMKNGGTLTISAVKETLKKAKPCGNDMISAGNYIKVIVTDTGTGIDNQHLPHIFEPFFTTKGGSNGSGTGLGLSTVYGIIRGCGGYISADSEVGIGTTFMIYLPQIEADTQIKQAKKVLRPVFLSNQTPTILLVDDEDSVRLVVARVLKSKNFIVIECANAEQALVELSKRTDIDLLITDMIMPGMDGETLIKKTKEINPKIKTLLMSGYSEDMPRHGHPDNTQLEFLAKPFELNQLLEKVKEIIEK